MNQFLPILLLHLTAVSAAAAPFDDALAVWHFADEKDSAGEHPLKIAGAVKLARQTPDDPAAWLPVATLAGNVQRRARLLAGLGRGG